MKSGSVENPARYGRAGSSLRRCYQAINARRPDFNAYIEPQKEFADVVIQVLPTNLMGRQRASGIRGGMLQRDIEGMEPVYLFDQGSTIHWTPCGRKLTVSYPGMQMFYGPDVYYGRYVSV